MAKIHLCKVNFPNLPYGEAFNVCYEMDLREALEDARIEAEGTLWIGNGEYSSMVNYCPVCGYKAKVSVSEYDEKISNV